MRRDVPPRFPWLRMARRVGRDVPPSLAEFQPVSSYLLSPRWSQGASVRLCLPVTVKNTEKHVCSQRHHFSAQAQNCEYNNPRLRSIAAESTLGCEFVNRGSGIQILLLACFVGAMSRRQAPHIALNNSSYGSLALSL